MKKFLIKVPSEHYPIEITANDFETFKSICLGNIYGCGIYIDNLGWKSLASFLEVISDKNLYMMEDDELSNCLKKYFEEEMFFEHFEKI
jgi:hypothetical protein